MASVPSTLARIKEDLQPFLPEESILNACRDAGHHWRQRVLGPVQTVHLFIVQVLCFNTAMTHLRHLGKTAVKAPAYCRARMRLPLAVLETLLSQSSQAMQVDNRTPRGLWCGLRAFLADGSSTIAPDTPDSQKAFGQPKGRPRVTCTVSGKQASWQPGKSAFWRGKPGRLGAGQRGRAG
jgi:hypothetical protein